MGEMKDKGFRFALDDFGAGMSSFSYLKNLPVDYLKIDGAFVRDIVTDPIDRAFVEAINRIGQVMGKETIAEFVENDAILRELNYIGVNYAQGYGIAPPVPLDGVAARRAAAHFRQNAGVSTTSRVNSSSRPSSMAKVHTQVWKSVSTA
jgi:EAL domain-containing protein (putative c-di-GMP-specific phosphodiesterase class I)